MSSPSLNFESRSAPARKQSKFECRRGAEHAAAGLQTLQPVGSLVAWRGCHNLIIVAYYSSPIPHRYREHRS